MQDLKARFLHLWVKNGRLRDLGAKICGATVFLFLAIATVVRIRLIFISTHGVDLLTAIQLVAAFSQTTFYLGFIWFTLIRMPPSRQAPGVEPRASALLGTFLPTAFGFFPLAERLPLAWHILAASLLLLGIALAAFLVLPRLGRSFSIMAEARQLVTGGPYRVIRHPLYVVEEIAALGAFIEVASLPASLLLLVHIAFQIRRIYNEEAVLEAQFPEYAAYKASTSRLIPWVW